MEPTDSQAQQNKLHLVGKAQRRFARRVSAADLSGRVRSRIESLMYFHECSDRTAEAAQKEFPAFRITGKTVTDVMVLQRKPVSRDTACAPLMTRKAGVA